MIKIRIAQAIGVIALLGGCLWKNKFSYPEKTTKWRVAKSIIDTTVIVLSALFYPALLVTWAVLFVTRRISSMGLRATTAVLAGIAFGSIGGLALEALCAFSVLTVDLVTGRQGVYGHWREPIPQGFLEWARSKPH